jgi:hypothetical protein
MRFEPFNNHILIAGESESGGQKEERKSASRRREGSNDAGYAHVCGGGAVVMHGKHDDYGSS